MYAYGPGCMAIRNTTASLTTQLYCSVHQASLCRHTRDEMLLAGACPLQGFLEMRFENRRLAAFCVARNFDRKQTPRSEISQTTRALVTPGPAEHPNLEAGRHFERSRRQKNAAWTSNALVAGLRRSMDADLYLTVRNVMTAEPLIH